jgi:hypothetical protein
MEITRLIKLIELDRTEAPKVRDPKIVKVAPNAPILQSKDKNPLILQSEKPEEVDEQSINLMTTYRGGPLEKGKTINPPNTVAAKLASKYYPSPKSQSGAGVILQPSKTTTSLRLAPAEESFLIPYVLEVKEENKRTLTLAGIFSIALIIGTLTAYFEDRIKEQCFSKIGKEKFECKKKLQLKELAAKISALRKRLSECYVKIDISYYFLRQHCIDNTVEKILDLREKYRELVAEKYKEPKRRK